MTLHEASTACAPLFFAGDHRRGLRLDEHCGLAQLMEAQVNAYELRISNLDTEAQRAGARWQLFACPEIRDLVRVGSDNRFLVLYDGIWPQPRMWCRILEDGGYDAEPVGEVPSASR